MFNLDETNRKSKEMLDGMMRNYSEVAKSLQAIATENTDYTRRCFQEMTSHFERLMGVRSIEAAAELNASYAKSSFEGLVAQSTKIGELYADLGKVVAKPLETMVAQAGATATAPN